MANSELIVEVEDGICWLYLNRPEKLNSITMEGIGCLRDELTRFKNDANVKAIVISGVGGKSFCTGLDLTALADEVGFFKLHQERSNLGELFELMWSYPKVIFAMVDGYALAAGFGLAAACDFVIASSESSFGAPEINVGLWPFVITVPLLRYINPRMLLDIMLTGRRITADEALGLGIINAVVAKADLLNATRTKVNEVISRSGSVIALGKTSFYQAMDMGSNQAFSYLHSMLSLATQLEDSKEGIEAFVHKRPPTWTDR